MHHFRLHISAFTGIALLTLTSLTAFGQAVDSAERHREEREGTAKIIHRADVIPSSATNNPARGGLWPLYATPEAKLNYFAVTGHTPLHFHPDAEHRLYVLEGKVLVTAGTNTTLACVGDFIVIPRGIRHSYDVPEKGDRALMLTFDAPPFDPRKTVSLETTPRRE
ncbi:MAG: cupin protein [Verrucomicrobiales bacterium]|nr:cupin protein [Verrucomicrobiales bacterium]